MVKVKHSVSTENIPGSDYCVKILGRHVWSIKGIGPWSDVNLNLYRILKAFQNFSTSPVRTQIRFPS